MSIKKKWKEVAGIVLFGATIATVEGVYQKEIHEFLHSDSSPMRFVEDAAKPLLSLYPEAK